MRPPSALRSGLTGLAAAFACAALATASTPESPGDRGGEPAPTTQSGDDDLPGRRPVDPSDLHGRIEGLGDNPTGIARVEPGQTYCPWPSGRIDVTVVQSDTTLIGPADKFDSLDNLLALLRGKLAGHYDPTGRCGRCINQLDIWDHGSEGGGYISFGPDHAQIGDKTMGPDFDQHMGEIGAMMCVGGKVVTNQCQAGKGETGGKALQALADKIGVPVSAPEGSIKACRVIGGALTHYRTMTPAAGSHTPESNHAGPVH